MDAVRNKDKMRIKNIVDRNKNLVNAKDEIGDNPLTQAIKLGFTEIVGILLECLYINVNIKECHGFTPLMLAAKYNHLNITNILFTI